MFFILFQTWLGFIFPNLQHLFLLLDTLKIHNTPCHFASFWLLESRFGETTEMFNGKKICVCVCVWGHYRCDWRLVTKRLQKHFGSLLSCVLCRHKLWRIPWVCMFGAAQTSSKSDSLQDDGCRQGSRSAASDGNLCIVVSEDEGTTRKHVWLFGLPLCWRSCTSLNAGFKH